MPIRTARWHAEDPTKASKMIEHISHQHLHPGPDIGLSHLKLFENSLPRRIRTHAMAMRAYELSREPLILCATTVHLFAHAGVARAFQALQPRMLRHRILPPANSTNPVGSTLF
jgi:hypothetical protein